MSDEMKDEPVVLAKRSATQAKNATRNAGRAAKAAAEPVVEEVRDTADKFEATAQDAVQTARRFNPRALSGMTGEIGMGFFALTVSIWAGTHAIQKFKGVYDMRKDLLASAAKDHIGTSS